MPPLFADPLALQQTAAAIVEAQLARTPELARRYGAIGRVRCLEDTSFHLNYLAQAVELDDPALFEDYIAWAKVMLASRGIGIADLTANLEAIRAAIAHEPAAVAIVDGAISRLAAMAEEVESFIVAETDLGRAAALYLDALLAGKRNDAEMLIRDLAARGTPLADFYLRIFEPVQREIGRLWQMNRITVAQEHFCTAAVQRSIGGLYATMFSGTPGRRRVVAACAGDELHEVGLRMVTDLLELNGWDTVYLGANVPIDSVVKTVASSTTSLIAISATITPHLRNARQLIAALRANPATAAVPVMVGGYPFRLSGRIAKAIGADAWAPDAATAVEIANRLVQ